jgi:hypothetical protein
LGKNIDVKRVIFGKMSLKKVTCKNIDWVGNIGLSSH